MSFEQAVIDGIALLRDLPRERTRVGEARERLGELRRKHPSVDAELVVDWTGVTAHVDYDLLLRDETHGTLALSHAPASHSPWSAAHAEHWAAQRVVTVDGNPLSVHDALQLWQARAALGPSWMDDLVDEALLSRVWDDDDAPSADEVRRAAGSIQRELGLDEADDAARWLEQYGFSDAGFETLARRALRSERWLDRLYAAGGSAYFEQHRSEFDRVVVAVAYGGPAGLAQLANQHRPGGSLLELVEAQLVDGDVTNASIDRCFGWQLPAELRDAPASELIGPGLVDGRLCLAQVIARVPCELDDEVARSVRTRLRERWLEAARASANIRWHWL